MTRYTVAKRDPLSGRYGSAVGYKATSPVEALLRSISISKRHPTSFTADDVVSLGGDRYRIGERLYRVIEVA